MKKSFIFSLVIMGMICPGASSAKSILPIEGYLDLQKQEYVLMLNSEEKGSISAKIDRTSENDFHISVNIDHLKISLIELSSQLEGVIELGQKANGQIPLIGKIWSQYSLVNRKPVEEFSGYFEVKDDKLFLKSVSFGGVLCRGWIDLKAPHNVDLTFSITALGLKDFLLLFGSDSVPNRGSVSGTIMITGNIKQLALKGQLVSYNGLLDNLEYESFHFNFEGIHPIIQINDSQIVRDDGIIFLLEGPLNLANKEDFDQQIEALTKAPIVNIDGENLEWTFKQIKEKGASSKTELKYLLKNKGSVGQSNHDQMDMFAVERSIEF